MGLDFIDRVRRTAAAAGIVFVLVLWARFGAAPAAAFAAGAAWSLVNIHVLRVLTGLLLVRPETSKLRIAAVLAVKAPVLYGAGYLLLASGRLPVEGLLAGFAWPLCVVVLKALGRLLLGLDRTGPALGARDPGRTGKGG